MARSVPRKVGSPRPDFRALQGSEATPKAQTGAEAPPPGVTSAETLAELDAFTPDVVYVRNMRLPDVPGEELRTPVFRPTNQPPK